MSYYLDGTNDFLTGTLLSGPYSFPCTVAFWAKFPTAHPAATDVFFAVGTNSGANTASLYVRTTATTNQWAAGTYDDAGTQVSGTVTLDIGTTWTPIVATFNSAGRATLYVGAIGNTGTSGTPGTITESLQYVRAGESFLGTTDALGYIAEMAMWSGELVTADITSYLSAAPASSTCLRRQISPSQRAAIRLRD
jgi:hypothetical protein